MKFFPVAQLSAAKFDFSVEFLASRKTQFPFTEGSPLFHLGFSPKSFSLADQTKSPPSFTPEVQKSPMKSLL